MDERAFPHPGHLGMTLRDYFAAKAMQGLAAQDLSLTPDATSDNLFDAVAADAYAFADAMLKAREQQ
jgi:hypothetical protein